MYPCSRLCFFGLTLTMEKVWLPSGKGKGLEIAGTFSRRGGQVYMDFTFANRSLQPMGDFAIQFNKNSFGLAPNGQ
jgi:AP-1 complex subunit beta-1